MRLKHEEKNENTQQTIGQSGPLNGSQLDQFAS